MLTTWKHEYANTAQNSIDYHDQYFTAGGGGSKEVLHRKTVDKTDLRWPTLKKDLKIVYQSIYVFQI